MNDLLQKLAGKEREALSQEEMPEWIEPTLATLTNERFSDPDWIFERKLDGERCITYCDQGKVRMLSRNQKKLNIHYPHLEKSLSGIDLAQYVVDGEIVAFEGKVTSFSRLQQRMHIQNRQEAENSNVAVYYYIFDLLHLMVLM